MLHNTSLCVRELRKLALMVVVLVVYYPGAMVQWCHQERYTLRFPYILQQPKIIVEY